MSLDWNSTKSALGVFGFFILSVLSAYVYSIFDSSDEKNYIVEFNYGIRVNDMDKLEFCIPDDYKRFFECSESSYYFAVKEIKDKWYFKNDCGNWVNILKESEIEDILESEIEEYLSNQERY